MSGALNAVAFSSGSLSASVSPASVTGYGFSGPIVAPVVTVSVKNGVGPFTYAWSRTVGVGGAARSPSSASTDFLANTNIDLQSVFVCAVTDTVTGLTVYVTVDVGWVVYGPGGIT